MSEIKGLETISTLALVDSLSTAGKSFEAISLTIDKLNDAIRGILGSTSLIIDAFKSLGNLIYDIAVGFRGFDRWGKSYAKSKDPNDKSKMDAAFQLPKLSLKYFGNSLDNLGKSLSGLDDILVEFSKFPSSSQAKQSGASRNIVSTKNFNEIFGNTWGKFGENIKLDYFGGKASTIGTKVPSKLGGIFSVGKGLTGNILGTAGKAITGGLAALGPQMLALTLIMKPVSALLEGLLEPLEPIIDLFGMVGEVIGLLLVPIVKALMDVLLPFMPLLMEIVMAFMPLIRIMLIPLMLLGNLLNAIMPLLTAFIGWFGNIFQLLDFISIPIEKLSNFLSDIIERFVSGITDWFERSSDVIKDWFQGIWDDITYFFEDLSDDWLLNKSA